MSFHEAYVYFVIFINNVFQCEFLLLKNFSNTLSSLKQICNCPICLYIQWREVKVHQGPV